MLKVSHDVWHLAAAPALLNEVVPNLIEFASWRHARFRSRRILHLAEKERLRQLIIVLISVLRQEYRIVGRAFRAFAKLAAAVCR